MKKNALSALLLLLVLASKAAYIPVVASDPQADAGANVPDIKSMAYEISADKKTISFRFITHSIVTDWNNKGFVFEIDEDLDIHNGESIGAGSNPYADVAFNNTSMKADRYVQVHNIGNWWIGSSQKTGATSGMDLTSELNVVTDDTSAVVSVPLGKFDTDGDMKFNLIAASAVTNKVPYAIDELPNAGYSTIDINNPSAITNTGGSIEMVKIYPNPANNNIIIFSQGGGRFTIYDLFGRVCLSTPVTQKIARLSVAELAKGIYIYHFEDGDIQIGRLVVENNE